MQKEKEKEKEKKKEKEKEKEGKVVERKIKHLVISGGGPSGIQTIGALQHLEKKEFWSIQNIETIYATSVGSMISILIALKFDWEIINDYIIKRPWHDTTQVKINQLFDMYSKKGLYDISLIYLFFKPFFDARDISLHITCKEFFELTKIELHFFALEINSFSTEDISYKTMPDMELLTCAYMSASIPILCSPICMNGKCFIDGGVLSNYPLQYCIEQIGKENIHEILGFKNCYEESIVCEINENSTIIEFTSNIIRKLVDKCSSDIITSIPNEVSCFCKSLTLLYLQEAIQSQEKRENLLNSGIKDAEKFIGLH